MDVQPIACGTFFQDAPTHGVRKCPSPSRSLTSRPGLPSDWYSLPSGSSGSSDSYGDHQRHSLIGAVDYGLQRRLVVDWHNYYQWGWDTIWDFSPPQSRYDLFPLTKSLCSRIPIEVVEAVIDCIEWQSLLCTCALVCRSWYHCSTTKLYQGITITSRIDFDRLSASARESTRVRERLALTRHLDIRSSAHTMPLVFGRLLPRLETLVLGEGCMSPPIHRSFFLALSQFPNITSLTMFGLELFNFTELRNIISRFPLLTKLSIIDVSCKHVPADRIAASIARPSPLRSMRLRELVIRGAWVAILHGIIDWLTASTLTCELISRLTVYGSVGEGTRHFQQLLRVTGRSLIDCQLDFKLGDHFDFRPNTKLRTLRLICHDPLMMHWPLLLRTLEDQLQSLQSAHLQRVSFDFQMNVDTLVRLGPFPDSLDPSSVHKAQNGEMLLRVSELGIHLSIVPGSPPVCERSSPLHEDPSSTRELVEKTAAAGLRTIFAPFDARGALRITTEVYEGETTSKFYSGASSTPLSVEDNVSLADASSAGVPEEPSSHVLIGQLARTVEA